MMQQLINIRSAAQAEQIVGGLSKVTKLPCLAYNLPAEACITGQKLACVEGTTCNGCYALRGWYPKKGGGWKRLEAIRDSRWVQAMVFLIKHYRQEYFRWHDSGNIQGTWHLKKICDVAEQTPQTKHWLPTREYEIVKKFRLGLGLVFPPNLTVRLSAHMIEGSPPPRPRKAAWSAGLRSIRNRLYLHGSHQNLSTQKRGLQGMERALRFLQRLLESADIFNSLQTSPGKEQAHARSDIAEGLT